MIHRLKDRFGIIVTRYVTNNGKLGDHIFRIEAHFEHHRKSIPHDFYREYECGYFSRLYTFLLKDHSAFLRREFLRE